MVPVICNLSPDQLFKKHFSLGIINVKNTILGQNQFNSSLFLRMWWFCDIPGIPWYPLLLPPLLPPSASERELTLLRLSSLISTPSLVVVCTLVVSSSVKVSFHTFYILSNLPWDLSDIINQFPIDYINVVKFGEPTNLNISPERFIKKIIRMENYFLLE